MSVVAAHPVHAEMRAARPKGAAKDPISLDAILVCRKRSAIEPRPYCLEDVISATNALSRRLTAGGLELSRADKFVIAASMALIAEGGESLAFGEIEQRIANILAAISSSEPATLEAAE
jgi:putative DNA methylase